MSRGVTSLRRPRTWVLPVSPERSYVHASTQTLPGSISVVLGPKLKPTYGICRDPTTTHNLETFARWFNLLPIIIFHDVL